jgi:SAM-dependent methyltransferase
VDADAWDERYAATDLVWSSAPNQFVEHELRDLPPGRALDLACGEGRNALWLASLGWQVTAVDFSQVAIEKGRGVDPDLEWVCADVTTWRPTSTYDAVVIAYLQLPAAERAAANRTAFDALAPSGTFLLVAHDTTNLTEGTGGPQDPSVLMSADDVLGDLAGREFTVEHAGRVPRLVGDGHGEEPQLTAWDCLVRLTRRT